MYINLDKAKDNFLKYTKNYDLKEPMINLKIEHSLRVMEISNLLAKKMNLNEEDTEIATAIGLLHDIARFEQYTKYRTYRDIDSIDHGDFAVEILDKDMRKYIETDKYDSLIKVAIRNHNKFNIEEGLSERELFFSKLIRDSDKLDILYEATYFFWRESIDIVNNSDINPNVYDAFCNHQLIKRVKGENYDNINKVLTSIAFIFDINFKESFEIIQEKNYINQILDRFDYKDKEIYENIRNIANKYIKDNI